MGEKTINLIYPQPHAHWPCKQSSFQRMSCFSPEVISVCALRPLPYSPDWSVLPGFPSPWRAPDPWVPERPSPGPDSPSGYGPWCQHLPIVLPHLIYLQRISNPLRLPTLPKVERALPCSHPAEVFASSVGGFGNHSGNLIFQASLPHFWAEGHGKSMPSPITLSKVSGRP